MILTTPPLSGRYIGYWRLRTAEGQNFGHRVWADVLVTGGTADLIDEGAMVRLFRMFVSSQVETKGPKEPPPPRVSQVSCRPV